MFVWVEVDVENELPPESEMRESRRWYNAGVVVVYPADRGAAKDARFLYLGKSDVGRPNKAAGRDSRLARREGGMASGRALGGNIKLGRLL